MTNFDYFKLRRFFFYSIIALMVLAFFLIPDISLAEEIELGRVQKVFGFIDEIGELVENKMQDWSAGLVKNARYLLISLGFLGFLWNLSLSLLKPDELTVGSIIFELAKLIVVISFLLFFIENAHQFSSAIIKFFVSTATSTDIGTSSIDPNKLKVSSILSSGFDVAGKILTNDKFKGWFGHLNPAFLLAVFMALFIIFAYAMIAGYLFVSLLEIYIISSAGIFLLAFGSNSFTTDIAKKYPVYIISAGIKLYVIYMILGLGEDLMLEMTNQLATHKGEITSYLVAFGIMSIYLMLVRQVPETVSSLINGVSMGGGSGLGAVGSAFKAAATTIGAIALASRGVSASNSVQQASKSVGAMASGGVGGAMMTAATKLVGGAVGAGKLFSAAKKLKAEQQLGGDENASVWGNMKAGRKEAKKYNRDMSTEKAKDGKVTGSDALKSNETARKMHRESKAGGSGESNNSQESNSSGSNATNNSENKVSGEKK